MPRADYDPPVYDGHPDHSSQTFDFSSFHGTLNDFQSSVHTRFQLLDERVERMHEQLNDMHQDWTSHASSISTKLDDMASIAQQQFEVLYHRQFKMQVEIDKCNKMAVYYHTPPGPPKPQPTPSQLRMYQLSNLTMDERTGVVHELPPGVPGVSSLQPLPTFGQIPTAPPIATFLVDPEFMPATRIPLFESGKPFKGPIHGPFTWVAPPFSGPSFSTTASFSPPSSSAPSSSSQGAPPS